MKPLLAKSRDTLERFADFDPATLYEAAGRTGMIDPSIRPAWPGAKVCGPAITVECPPCDNLMLHIAVANAPPGCVIVATVGSYVLAGAWGEILTEAARARGVGGLVIDGAVRDIDAIEALKFPVFSRGAYAQDAAVRSSVLDYRCRIRIGDVEIVPGARGGRRARRAARRAVA